MAIEGVLVPDGERPDRASLVVRFRVSPGWHVYWKNPGEGGIATHVELDPAIGVKAGPIRFPRPIRFATEYETTFGHEGEFVLVVPLEVAPGASIPASVPFSAQWLVCKDICLAGSAKATATRGSDAVRTAIAKQVDSLPRPFEAWTGATAKVEGGALRIRGPALGATRAVFFPHDTPGTTYAEPQIVVEGDRVRIEVPLAFEPENALGNTLTVGGLVGLGPADGPSYEFSFPAPVS